MPLFMDVHHKVEGLTAEAVAGAVGEVGEDVDERCVGEHVRA